MKKNESKNVESNVENSSDTPKKKPKYKKGKFPFTVQDRKTKVLYIRKSITVNLKITDPKTGKEKTVKQRQIWRICDPPTKEQYETVLAEIENGLKIAKSGKPKISTKFSEIAKEFEAIEFAPAVFRNNKKVSGKIQTEVPKIYLKYLVSHFGSQEIETISYSQIQEYKRIRLSSPVEKYVTKKTFIPKTERPKGSRKRTKIEKVLRQTPRSIRSVNYELAILKQFFNYAIREKLLARSPFDDGRNLIETRAETKRSNTWTKAEETAALALCVGEYAHIKPVILLVVDGGLRRGEIVSAEWKDVDFDHDVILAKNYKGTTLRVRPVFLTKRLKEALKEWRKIQKKDKRITNKERIIGFGDFKKSWITIRAKIGRSDLRLHDLRHVFATRLSERRVPLNAISELLGHSQISTTQIYLNPSAEHLRASIQTLEDDS